MAFVLADTKTRNRARLEGLEQCWGGDASEEG
jgi:hypothetical protein